MKIDKWDVNSFLRKLKKEKAKHLQTACRFLANRIKSELGTKSPPPSGAGEYPHLVDGELRRSVTVDVNEEKMLGRVGTNKIYGKYLEKGTRKMDARPFLERTLEANRSAVGRLLKGR